MRDSCAPAPTSKPSTPPCAATFLQLLDQIFNLKFTSKQLVRAAKKCEKEEKDEKLKIKKAIEKGGWASCTPRPPAPPGCAGAFGISQAPRCPLAASTSWRCARRQPRASAC